MSGIVYCLTNPAMPDYVKIGQTTNLVQRLQALDNTSTPLPFECVYAIEVEDMDRVERLLHQTFADHRTRSSREFFVIGEQRVIAAMQLAGGRDVTPSEDVVEDVEAQRALETARAKRAAFNFNMVGITPGTVLYFDDEAETTCVVRDVKRVEFEGDDVTLTAAAAKVFGRRPNPSPSTLQGAVQGPAYWYLEGESMSERRDRLEAEG